MLQPGRTPLPTHDRILIAARPKALMVGQKDKLTPLHIYFKLIHLPTKLLLHTQTTIAVHDHQNNSLQNALTLQSVPIAG